MSFLQLCVTSWVVPDVNDKNSQEIKKSYIISVNRFIRIVRKSVKIFNLYVREWGSSHSYAGFRLACRSPLCRVIIAYCFRVTDLSSRSALALSPSSITPELNRIQLYAVCHCRQSSGVINLLARGCLPLSLPSAASGACAVVQNSPSKRQCSERQASLKAAFLLIIILSHYLPVFVSCQYGWNSYISIINIYL